MLSIVTLTTMLVAQLGDAPAAATYPVTPASLTIANETASAEAATVTPLPPVGADATAPAPVPANAQASSPPGTQSSDIGQPGPEYMTRDEVQAEVRKLAWAKGDFKIVPYGTIWGAMSYDSQRAKIGDYCLWIESQTTHPKDPDYSVDGKSTRIGFDMSGPGIPCLDDAKIGGKVEVDFQGQYLTRNKPGLLLRHAYVEATDDEFRLLIGQTWDVISPLYIPTLNYTAGSAVGNLAYRRAQFRAERYFALSDTEMITLQSSLNANAVTDFVGETDISSDAGPYPDLQARAALTLGQRKGPDARPIVIGISGHGGEQDFDFRGTSNNELDVERPTWSIDADLSVPITDCLGFQCEFFHGENLSNYMGGIMQGVDRITHRGIHATGGWCDLWYKWTPTLCSHTGYALDDPANGDMTSGRVYNQMIFANMLYNATKNLQLGMEVDVWETHYIGLKPGKATRLECAVKYMF